MKKQYNDRSGTPLRFFITLLFECVQIIAAEYLAVKVYAGGNAGDLSFSFQ